MPSIKSRVNGLEIAIPADAKGVIGRFATAGGNELVFEKQARQAQAQKGKGKVSGKPGSQSGEALA